MIQFNLPTEFNGATFLNELKNAGIDIDGLPMVDDGKLYLKVDKNLEIRIAALLKKHDGSDLPDPRTAILERLGITADEAALLLL